MSAVFPWHAAEWAELGEILVRGRLGHALLLHGPAGWGKGVFARQFARRLLGLSCGSCDTAAAGLESADSDLLAHPDARVVTREPAPTSGRLRTQITVDQIRELASFLAQTSGSGGRRVVVLERAEELNVNAANALLKSLEEPGADTHLLLVSDAPSRTLATIRSRCQMRPLMPGTAAQASRWLSAHLPEKDVPALLALAGGAPLSALDLHALNGVDLARSVDRALREGRVAELVEMPGRLDPDEQRARAQRIVDFLYRALARRIRANAEGTPALGEHRLLDRVLAARRMLASTSNPNVTLLLEDLLQPMGRDPRAR